MDGSRAGDSGRAAGSARRTAVGIVTLALVLPVAGSPGASTAHASVAPVATRIALAGASGDSGTVRLAAARTRATLRAVRAWLAPTTHRTTARTDRRAR